jgi:cellulose synthase/poly-beta-1,6-N-acetylglucosamine synthase-like glycosyltransferase
LADIALLVLLPFFFGPIIFLAFILSMILTFIGISIYRRELHSLERELARLGMAKPSPPTITKLMEDEEIKIIPAY